MEHPVVAARPSWYKYGSGKEFALSRHYPVVSLMATIRLAYARGAGHVPTIWELQLFGPEDAK